MDDELSKVARHRDRLIDQFRCVSAWLEVLESGTNLCPYFVERGHKSIAIYGAAALGRLLLTELRKESKIHVQYFLDRTAKAQNIRWGIPVYLPEEMGIAADVDIVVVTAISAFEDICQMLLRIKPEIPCVSLERIIDDRMSEVWYEQQCDFA